MAMCPRTQMSTDPVSGQFFASLGLFVREKAKLRPIHHVKETLFPALQLHSVS